MMFLIKETDLSDLTNIRKLWADGDVMKFVGFPNGLKYSDEDINKIILYCKLIQLLGIKVFKTKLYYDLVIKI